MGAAICTLSIAAISNYGLLIFVRFMNGFFISCFDIFDPVWIDQYGPKTSNSILMAFHHLESILGTIFGFILTSRISLVVSWRYSFLIQAILLFLFFIAVSFMDSVFFSSTLKRVKTTNAFIDIDEKNNNLNNGEEIEPQVPCENNLTENISVTSKTNAINTDGDSSRMDLERESSNKTDKKNELIRKRQLTYKEMFCLLMKNKVI